MKYVVLQQAPFQKQRFIAALVMGHKDNGTEEREDGYLNLEEV